jgi:pimeloyl-ACP methyl ester carboxylesterase
MWWRRQGCPGLPHSHFMRSVLRIYSILSEKGSPIWYYQVMLTDKKTETVAHKHFFRRHRWLLYCLIGLIVILIAPILIIAGLSLTSQLKVKQQQAALRPFYDTTGLSTTGPIGEVMRRQPLGTSVANGTAQRILYRTQKADGTVTFTSGMVFIPSSAASGGPRPVVAWAHGTVGMGDQCAPSRTPNPVKNIAWVSEMLKQGWVVTATDYAGLGTPGIEGYLVGGDESRDVLNSVQALKYIPEANAGTTFAVWGHSQGGHSALFTANQASAYAPNLKLIGTVASAPAAELGPLLSETNGTAIDWVIGPEAMEAWPTAQPGLNVAEVTTAAGFNNYKRIANKCIESAALEGLVRTRLHQEFFKINLADSPSWAAMAKAQTAPILEPSQPLMIAESLTDQVVLPNTTALYIEQACKAKSNLTSLWLTDVGHIQLSSTIAPDVIGWIGDRFANRPTSSTCAQPLPITPAAAS